MEFETKQKIIEYLKNNREYIKSLIIDLRIKYNDALLNNHYIWRDEILMQYAEQISQIILDDITKSLAVDPESAMLVMLDMNMEEYLK